MKGKTNVNINNAVDLNDKAIIYVESRPGSTITFKKNDVIVKELTSNDAHIKNSDSNIAVYYFSVNSNNFGEWTVIASLDGSIDTKTITVSSNEVYKVILKYRIYIVKRGTVVPEYTMNKHGPSNTTLTQELTCVLLHSNKASSTYATCSFTPEFTFPISGYHYIVCEHQVKGYYASGKCPAYGVLNSIASGGSTSSFVTAKVLLSGSSGSTTSRATTYLNIDSVTGTHRIGFQEAGSSQSSIGTGEFYCYQLYISKDTLTTQEWEWDYDYLS